MRALHPSNKSITQRMGLILPIALSLFFILSLPMAFADYPVISTEKGINPTQAKQLVFSIPEQYYFFVKEISFITKPAKTIFIDEYGKSKDWDGQYKVYWNKNHSCYNGKIILSSINKGLLRHELGHIYEICILKKDISTEEFADNFRINFRK